MINIDCRRCDMNNFSIKNFANIAFVWRMEYEYPIVRNIHQFNDKLDDTKCEMYALVLRNDPVPTTCNCIDINKIPSRSMLEDPAICCFIPVYVYEMKGYSDTEVIREYYGRVF